MALAFQQLNISIAAEAYIQITISGSLLGEPDVAGVKPIVTAGGHNFFPAGCRWHWRRFGKTQQFVRRENVIGDLILRRKLFAYWIRGG